MSQLVYEAGQFSRITASTTVLPRGAAIIGIGCASASSTPTISVFDSESLGVIGSRPQVMGQYTPVSATFQPIPAVCENGITVIISGTVDCTVFYQQRS